MDERVLRLFPARAHALVVASDPDRLLDEEGVREELGRRGYRIVCEEDSLRLWLEADRLRPWTMERPALIITRGALRRLPYDLWEEGYRIEVSLAALYPWLSYPVVRELTAEQRARLDEAEAPVRALGRRETVEHVLEEVFGTRVSALHDPGGLLLWLNDMHSELGPLGELVRAYLVECLGRIPGYASWPLEGLLRDRGTYRGFLQEAWEAYVARAAGSRVREKEPGYLGVYDEPRVQSGLGGLVRQGNLGPVRVAEPERLPRWAQVAVERDLVTEPTRALGEALGAVEEGLAGALDWDGWCRVAWEWARATVVRRQGLVLPEEMGTRLQRAEEALDGRFAEWLRARYTALAGERLPIAHHVHHVPHVLAQARRRGGDASRVALLVLDGMSLADWVLIRREWSEGHGDWWLEEGLVMAQVPTVTAISRQALVSGRRPAEFAETALTDAAEGRWWAAFWSEQGLGSGQVLYELVALDRGPVPEGIESARLVAACLVDHSIDELSHGATLGAAQVQDSLRRWLKEHSPKLEALIGDLLGRGFRVTVCSDHGHVEAKGVGRPREGALADARGQRMRAYGDLRVARGVQEAFPGSMLWADDGVLPEGMYVVMPGKREAYGTWGETMVTHGGITLDEVMVPLITIARRATWSG